MFRVLYSEVSTRGFYRVLDLGVSGYGGLARMLCYALPHVAMLQADT